jgi:hypothetical protein
MFIRTRTCSSVRGPHTKTAKVELPVLSRENNLGRGETDPYIVRTPRSAGCDGSEACGQRVEVFISYGHDAAA